MPVGSRVAVLVETSTSWGSQLVKGIGNYACEHGPWLFFIEPRGRYEQLRMPKGWTGDGIIARVNNKTLAREIIETGLPAVNLSWFDHGEGAIPRCMSDERYAGQLAAGHFLERGFEQFAYCGPLHRHGYTDRLCDSYVRAVEERGFGCTTFRLRHSKRGPATWESQLAGLSDWLNGLPKPVGLLAWNDVRGRQVTEACQHVGIRVPEEVAVLGGEYDELMGSMSSPPLSSIDHSPARIGFAASEMLDRMMAGGAVPERPVLIKAFGVMVRESTDILAIDDGVLATAISYIRQSAHEGIRVDDVLRHVAISRRLLEQRFIEVLGRSPAAEIRRVKLNRAKRLLADTDLSMARVAAASGFNEPESLTRAFRREFGVTPSEYRRSAANT